MRCYVLERFLVFVQKTWFYWIKTLFVGNWRLFGAKDILNACKINKQNLICCFCLTNSKFHLFLSIFVKHFIKKLLSLSSTFLLLDFLFCQAPLLILTFHSKSNQISPSHLQRNSAITSANTEKSRASTSRQIPPPGAREDSPSSSTRPLTPLTRSSLPAITLSTTRRSTRRRPRHAPGKSSSVDWSLRSAMMRSRLTSDSSEM